VLNNKQERTLADTGRYETQTITTHITNDSTRNYITNVNT